MRASRPGAATGGSVGAGPAPGWRRLAGHPVTLAVAVTAAGAAAWIVFFPRVGTDLPAAIARAGWAGSYPGSGYLFSWYGGFYPAGYSLLAPYVLAVCGVRPAMAAAGVIAAGLLAWLLARHRVPRPRVAALWGAAALLTQLTAGRAAFTLGLAAALGCVAAASLPRHPLRWPAMAGLALVSGLLSPVTALFLGVPAAALLLTGRRREGLVIGLAAALPLGITAAVPDGGVQPAAPQTWLPPLAAAIGVLLLVPERWRVVRAGALVYGVGVLAAWAVPTPVGSNVERLGLLLAGPLLAGLGQVGPALLRPLLPLALAAVAAWQVAQPVTDLAHGNAPPYAPQTAALAEELHALHAGTARAEAVPQYGHWESQQLADVVWLARGWERQLDMARNPLFYGGGTLTPGQYYRWLRDNAVRYVAICRGSLDWAAVAEAQIVNAGQPWLVPVWHDRLWRLYRVAGAVPLASPPARVVSTSPARITLWIPRAGTTLVRVRWSPLLRATAGGAVGRRGPWAGLTVRRPGTYSLTAPYELAR
jgi:hypothetical protein